MHVFSRTAATVGVAGVILAALAGTALADPPSGTVPAHTDIVGVGSDTSQLLLDQLSTDYNTAHSAPKLYSFDAVDPAGTVPPPNIVTKTGCTSVARPNGSGAGIAALKLNTRPSGDTTDYCVDFARSSRGTQAGDTTAVAFVAFAQDAVDWSNTNTATKPTHAPTALSILELDAIYSCNASLIPHTPAYPATPVIWSQVGGTGSNAVVPVIPQSSSGTRAFFLKQIGVSTLGTCVVPTNDSVEENEGTNTIFSGANSQDIVFPYSVAVYLAQSQRGHGTGTQGNQVLGSVLNTSGTAIAPTTGTSPNSVINGLLSTVGLIRSIYNVVRNDGSSVHVPSYLRGVLGSANDTGYLCTDATAQADITSFGFKSLSTNCGTVTVGMP